MAFFHCTIYIFEFSFRIHHSSEWQANLIILIKKMSFFIEKGYRLVFTINSVFYVFSFICFRTHYTLHNSNKRIDSVQLHTYFTLKVAVYHFRSFLQIYYDYIYNGFCDMIRKKDITLDVTSTFIYRLSQQRTTPFPIFWKI